MVFRLWKLEIMKNKLSPIVLSYVFGLFQLIQTISEFSSRIQLMAPFCSNKRRGSGWNIGWGGKVCHGLACCLKVLKGNRWGGDGWTGIVNNKVNQSWWYEVIAGDEEDCTGFKLRVRWWWLLKLRLLRIINGHRHYLIHEYRNNKIIHSFAFVSSVRSSSKNH